MNEPIDAFRQGDVIESIAEIHIDGADPRPTPHGVVLISQTCDIVQATRPNVLLVPLTYLDDSNARNARDGKWPQYVPVPAISELAFADLEVIGTTTKERLATLRRTPGVLGDGAIRRFGRDVGRRFSRFAFPDEVVPYLKPLEELIGKASRREQSPLGPFLADIAEIRVEATHGWSPPYRLVLAVILRVSARSTLDDEDLPEIPDDLDTFLYGGDLPRVPAIAEMLSATGDPVRIHFLQNAIVDAMAAACVPKDPKQRRPNVVQEITGEITTEADFSLHRARRSELLDLDHLSAPTPE